MFHEKTRPGAKAPGREPFGRVPKQCSSHLAQPVHLDFQAVPLLVHFALDFQHVIGADLLAVPYVAADFHLNGARAVAEQLKIVAKGLSIHKRIMADYFVKPPF